MKPIPMHDLDNTGIVRRVLRITPEDVGKTLTISATVHEPGEYSTPGLELVLLEPEPLPMPKQFTWLDLELGDLVCFASWGIWERIIDPSALAYLVPLVQGGRARERLAEMRGR